MLALALALRAEGHEPRLCVPPNFREWIESFGLTCMTTGPDVKKLTGGSTPAISVRTLTAEQRRELGMQTIRSQFQDVHAAARGCDLIVGAGELQLAARSIAELLGILYVFACFCPITLPSPDHPPLLPSGEYLEASSEPHSVRWKAQERSRDDLFLQTLNEQRAAIGLAAIDTVQRHVFTERPWLAADLTLGPAATALGDMQIVQTGAWLLPEQAALPEPLERFLAAGEPPLYFGFGSMSVPEGTGDLLLEAARALGQRAILSRGWADLAAADAGADCIHVEEVDHARLFPRVAAIAHHGGAGTTTTAALARRPQLIVPRMYDQFYWAQRVQDLGIGVAGPAAKHVTLDSLVDALRACLIPEKTAAAYAVASRIELHGARNAAQRLVTEFG